MTRRGCAHQRRECDHSQQIALQLAVITGVNGRLIQQSQIGTKIVSADYYPRQAEPTTQASGGRATYNSECLHRTETIVLSAL